MKKNSLKKLVIIGGGGYAKVVISIIKKIETYNIVGYTDLQDQGEILGIPYLGNDDKFISEYHKYNVKDVFLGIGQLQDSNIKRRIVDKYRSERFNFPYIISPSAIISDDVKIGEGSIIRDGAIVSCSTRIGNFSIIGTSVNINHDSIIGDYCNIAIGSIIGVNVIIFDQVFIGMGSTVINKIKISNNIFVGAGSLVTRDCFKQGVYYGRPAKIIRDS